MPISPTITWYRFVDIHPGHLLIQANMHSDDHKELFKGAGPLIAVPKDILFHLEIPPGPMGRSTAQRNPRRSWTGNLTAAGGTISSDQGGDRCRLPAGRWDMLRFTEGIRGQKEAVDLISRRLENHDCTGLITAADNAGFHTAVEADTLDYFCRCVFTPLLEIHREQDLRVLYR